MTEDEREKIQELLMELVGVLLGLSVEDCEAQTQQAVDVLLDVPTVVRAPRSVPSKIYTYECPRCHGITLELVADADPDFAEVCKACAEAGNKTAVA